MNETIDLHVASPKKLWIHNYVCPYHLYLIYMQFSPPIWVKKLSCQEQGAVFIHSWMWVRLNQSSHWSIAGQTLNSLAIFHSRNGIMVTFLSILHNTATLDIPDADALIKRSGSDWLAVRRERHRPDPAWMTLDTSGKTGFFCVRKPLHITCNI